MDSLPHAVVIPVAALTVAMLTACAAHPAPPDREAEAVGAVRGVEALSTTTEVAFAPDTGYEYFEGTTFVLDAEVPVSGAVTQAADIEPGDRLQVWTGACAESFPVQCAVEFVEVLD